MYNQNKQNEQIYGRNDMVMLDKHNKIYGSLGIAEQYVFNTVEGNPVILRHPKEGKLKDVATEFEMQGWTEQEETTGAQLFDASKISTKSACGANVTNNGDGSFTISGEGKLSGTYSNSIVIPYESFFEIKEGPLSLLCDRTNPYFFFQLQNENHKVIANIDNTTSDSNTAEITQDIAQSIKRVIVGFYGGAGTDIKTGTIKPMVYQNGDGTWESYTGGAPSPSPDYPQEIVSAGKYNEDAQKWEYEIGVGGAQLIDASKLKSTAIGNVTITNNGDGSFTVGGNGVISNNVNYAYDLTKTETLNLIKAGELCLKVDQALIPHFDILIHYNEKFQELLGTSTSIRKFEITNEILQADDFYLRMRFYGNSEETIKPGTVKPMLYQYGDGTYEPYRTPQTVLLTADRPLTKWDKLEKRNGQWGLVYKSAEINITDESPLQKYGDDKISLYVFDAYLLGTPFCEKYVCQNGVPATENRIGLNSGSHAFVIYDTRYLDNVESYKQWLSENPLTLWYETTEETFVPLSETEQEQMNALTMNTPTTVISNDVEANMKITYKSIQTEETVSEPTD